MIVVDFSHDIDWYRNERPNMGDIERPQTHSIL